MRTKVIPLFTLILTLIIGSHDTTLSLGFLNSAAAERSEEAPSRESEEHASEITWRVIRPLMLGPGKISYILSSHNASFRKLVIRPKAYFKSSLHILFLSLRH